MKFRVLGPLEVDAGDGPVPLGGPKQRAVLATLVMRANEVVPVETLIDAVWGEEPPDQARNTLQTYVSSLRKSLGDGLLVGRPPGYVLVVDPLDVDATRFDTLVREARKTLAVDPGVAIETLEDALAMWRGPALADVADRALLAEAGRLDELRLEAQEERIGALLEVGMAGRAIGELEPLVAQHPLRERLWGQLILAFYRDGRQAGALTAFQRVREILADELGIDPSPDLARLHQRVLEHDPSLELRGEPLRGYRLLEKLGETRTGVRFRAIQPRVGRDVEIELVHEHLANAPTFVERFGLDAEAVAALEHPHIVPIYDHWREPGRAYVVRRYLRAETLGDRMRRGERLDPTAALTAVAQISSALAHAHRQGVAHGDLDEDAVAFDGDGNAYLSGFPIGTGERRSQQDDVRAFASVVADLVGDGDPAPFSALITAARTGDVPRAEAFADAARAALIGASPAALPADDRTPRNPYRGLRPFTESDSHDFFGRSTAVRDVVGRLAPPAQRFVAVVGPSGCGKSSLVRAGVVPALRSRSDRDGTFVTELTPGTHPFDALEAALGPIAIRPIPRVGELLRRSSRGLLEAVAHALPPDAEAIFVVDQLEELFTLTQSEHDRAELLECIRVASVDPESQVRVIATLRADFYDRPLVYPRFGELLAATTYALTPLQPDELERAIRGPAERVGVHPDSGVVAEIVADSVDQPGSLPLVQFALTELFERRNDGRMTTAAYRELGGIVGSLSASADAAVRDAGSEERKAIRQMFLRLVTLGEGRPDTRRRVARSELDALDPEPATMDHLLGTFGRLRILTFDREATTREPTVEIAHEALLTSWGTLRRWIDEARDDLRTEALLARAAMEWAVAGEDRSFVPRGARLAQAEAWLSSTDLVVAHDVRRFVAAGTAQRRDEEFEADRRRVRVARIERRAARRLRGLVAVFAIAALVAASLTIVATDQSDRAERESQIAFARELASASVSSLFVDPELSVLLAIESVERARGLDPDALDQAVEALHLAIATSRIVATIPNLGGSIAAGPDGMIVAERLDRPGVVTLLRGTNELRSIDGHAGDVQDVALSSDGRFLVTSDSDGWVRAWSTEDGSMMWELHRSGSAGEVSIDVGGDRVAASWPQDGHVVVVDARTARALEEFFCIVDGCHAAFSPDGHAIAVAAVRSTEGGVEAGSIVPFDGGPVTTFRAPPWAGINGALTWSPDGRLLSGSSFIWSTEDGSLLHTAEHGLLVTSSAWNPNGTGLVTGAGGTARVWDVDPTSFSSRFTLSVSDPADVTDVAYSADGTTVVTASDALRLWDVTPLGDAELAGLALPTVYGGQIAFSPSGTELLIGVDDPGHEILRTATFGWTIGDAGARQLVPRRLARPVDVNPANGSLVLVRDSTATIVTEDEVRGLPIEADSAAWTPDGSHLIVAGRRRLRLVDLSGEEIWRARAAMPIGVLEVAGDGRIAVAAGDADEDDTVQVFGRDGGEIATFAVPTHVYAIRFGPGTDTIVTDDDGAAPLEIWRASTGQRIGTYADETQTTSFDISPDGRSLAVSDQSQVVRLYDTASSRLRLTFPLPDELLGDSPERALGDFRCFASRVTFSPDGSILAAQGCAGVRIWSLDIDELLAIARDDVTRSLTAEECRTYLRLDSCSAG